MEIGAANLTENSREQFNVLMGNMVNFSPEDMAGYDECYKNVFSKGVNISYMGATFFAQFSAELLVGMFCSNPFRKFMIKALDNEKEHLEGGGDIKYWEPTMEENRFGIEGRDYSEDIKDLYAMMNVTYDKISSLNKWFGTEDGKKEFDMYCLSKKAVRDIKRIVCEYPYLIKKYDHDKDFANEIMEFAGVIAQQIIQTAKNGENGQ